MKRCDDLKNIEAWAEVIKDMLGLVPIEQRAVVLALVVKNEEAEREANNGVVRMMDVAELKNEDNTPGLRHWNAIMRLSSLVVQVLVRRIANNHSPEDAANILFMQHYGRGGRGSGLLEDYLRPLQGKETRPARGRGSP
jgi:hypothetical protein